MGAALGLPADPGVAAAAVEACTGPSERPEGVFAEGVSNPRTLLHGGHVANPDGGGWRGWPREVRRRVQPRLAALQEEFGYPVELT